MRQHCRILLQFADYQTYSLSARAEASRQAFFLVAQGRLRTASLRQPLPSSLPRRIARLLNHARSQQAPPHRSRSSAWHGGATNVGLHASNLALLSSETSVASAWPV